MVTKASTPSTHSDDSPKPQRFPRGAARLAAATWLEFERVRASPVFLREIDRHPPPPPPPSLRPPPRTGGSTVDRSRSASNATFHPTRGPVPPFCPRFDDFPVDRVKKLRFKRGSEVAGGYRLRFTHFRAIVLPVETTVMRSGCPGK